jgi:isocitrate dehydrogenase kinase/phosphatase
MVDASIPSQYVLFLKSLMPAKPISEIYSAMGYNKHGKTYFYRSAVRHMESSLDKFIVAPGIKGMVMSVFTLPSYPYVFKVIKDRFTPPKEVTHEEVRPSMRWSSVPTWPDAWRIRRSSRISPFDRSRFSDELMEELRSVAPSLLMEKGRALVIRHLYVERRMTPLNLYLQDAQENDVDAVMDDYGQRDQAARRSEYLPRRHAAEELWRNASRPRGVL